MVSTLKKKCLLLLRHNNMLQSVKPFLKNLPHSLLLELCLYLSPYGLQIIQDNTDISAMKLSTFWFGINTIPSSYVIESGRYNQIKLTSCRPSSQHDYTTNQEFFYNSLLFSIIFGIHIHDWRSNFSSCLEKAWSKYLLLPTPDHAIVHFTPPEEGRGKLLCRMCRSADYRVVPPRGYPKPLSEPILNISLFLKTLARFVTELPMTLASSEALITHQDVFMPILCNVRKLSLDLDKFRRLTPFQITKDIVELFQLILNKNTRVFSLRVQFRNTHDCHEPNFQHIWNIIHNAVFVSDRNFEMEHGLQDTEMSLELQQQSQQYELQTIQRDSIDETMASHYEPCRKRVKYFVHNRTSVFEPLLRVGGPSIENRILFLELNFPYNAEKIYQTLTSSVSLWKNLRCLVLKFNDNVEFDYFSNVLDSLVCFGNLRELMLFGLDCKPHHEQSIVNAASPKFCPQHTNSNESYYSQLESLSLNSCSFRTTMLVDILNEFKWCDRSLSGLIENSEENSSYCYYRGLTSLHVTVDGLHNEHGKDNLLSSILHRNVHLKELKIVLKYVEEPSFPVLLRSMKSHQNLTTLDVSSVYTRMTPDQSDLSGVLTGKTLTQLRFSSCFAKGIPPSIFDGDFTKSRMVTLIWSNNSLGNNGLDCISKKLADRQQLQHLLNLDLSSNYFDIDAVIRFIDSLEIRCCRPFQTLALCGKNVSAMALIRRGLQYKLKEHCFHFVETFSLNNDMSGFENVL